MTRPVVAVARGTIPACRHEKVSLREPDDTEACPWPAAAPGGLESAPLAHVGHCDVFALVAVRDGKIGKMTIPPIKDAGMAKKFRSRPRNHEA